MFANRRDAGRRLAEMVAALDLEPPVIVVGLPRGGVPVAADVATRLGAPLDVVLVRKIGVPGHVELAMGAVGEGGVTVRSDDVVARTGVSEAEFTAARDRAQRELDEQTARFRPVGRRTPLRDHTVVIVDDGIATGATVRAACAVVRASGAARIVVATPVAPAGWTDHLGSLADDFVAVSTPSVFGSVGACYADFTATTDAEVRTLLART